jgi:hypothetical protein
MNENLSSTPSTDEQPGPTIPAAYTIYGEEVPDFEEGVGSAFWLVVFAVLTIVCLLGWAAYLTLTTAALVVATLGTLVVLGAWWGCHWLAGCLDRDDRKAEGYEE